MTRAMRLTQQGPAGSMPLVRELIDLPEPGERQLLVRVSVCGICHTDLHIVEGDLALPHLPLTPGHQIVGRVMRTGAEVTRFHAGDRVGIPWLHATCGRCASCTSGRENLCDRASFTGYTVDGGYADHVVAEEQAVYALPGGFTDAQAAPLLCAGVIGFRALRLSGVEQGGRLALYGFGASAHITLQVARSRGCIVDVVTRGTAHRQLAMELGAAWTGSAEEKPPAPADGAIIFAPAGGLVHAALRTVRKGGTVALAGIHMSPIPELPYSLLYEERVLRSVAHSTHRDVEELLEVAAAIPVRTDVEIFPLEKANEALLALKESRIRGSGVLVVEGS